MSDPRTPPDPRSSRELAEDFDAFYAATRARLLLQTLALTGDLPASRSAVRDAFLVAWHHWRKLSRDDDPEAAVRPMAWRYARRRAGARPWHKERSAEPEARAVLAALAGLSVEERKALLLSQLAHTTMPDLARELGVPLEEAERSMQTATASFSMALDLPPGGVRGALEPLAELAAAATWPRTTIIRRAGAARRRAHTVVGALGVVAVLVGSGALVTDATGVRPTLDGAGRPDLSGSLPAGPTVSLPESALLSADDVGQAAALKGVTWSEGRTSDNSAGDGTVLACQHSRYLDPDGDAAFVRSFEPDAAKGTDAPSLVQLAEASDDAEAAGKSYRRALHWLSDCDSDRVQLLRTDTVKGVGDDAVVMTLRSWADPATVYAVGVARTGAFTTATMLGLPGADAEPAAPAAGVLAGAVDRLCSLDDGGRCAAGGEPRLEGRPPPKASRYPGLLNPADLPPVTGVDQMWTSAKVTAPPATATPRCDSLSFTEPFKGTAWDHTQSRPFVILDAGLPDEFGLTETVGTLNTTQAQAVVTSVRDAYAKCPEQDLGSDVVRVADSDDGDTSLSAWQVTTELTDDRTLRTWTAILRVGSAVGQIYFSAAEGATFADGDFVPVAKRALERLAELPGA